MAVTVSKSHGYGVVLKAHSTRLLLFACVKSNGQVLESNGHDVGE
jgi:hypothetical protein